MNNEDQIKSQVGDVSAFIDGQKDCRDGKPHQEGRGDSYDAGFAFEFNLEQVMNELYPERYIKGES